jgi:uncharacterized protein (TIGR00255 family)
MTGYGAAKGGSGALEISIELKSVNNRYLDCSVKIPRAYMAAEEPLKAIVARHISRGKADVFVSVDASGAQDAVVRVNKPAAAGYLAALRGLAEEYGLSAEVSAMELTRFPDVLQVEKRETGTEELYADLAAALEDALRGFDGMRAREGERLFEDVTARLAELERLAARAAARSPETVAEYRARLSARMAEVLQNTELDESRILTEAAIFADKIAVNEELVRIDSHLGQIRAALDSGEPVGRRLDFLVQELNREANTLGSKCSDAELAGIVVDMKAEIEKIREQAQNIE